MKRLYHLALRLYPVDYRTRFAAEMSAAFDAAIEARGALCLHAELAGLAAGIAKEWFAKLTSDRSARGRELPDLRMMRPPGVARSEWFRGA
jgi:hypothetical protein